MSIDLTRIHASALKNIAQAIRNALESGRYSAWTFPATGDGKTWFMTSLLVQMSEECDESYMKNAYDLASTIIWNRLGNHSCLYGYFQARTTEKVEIPAFDSSYWRQKALEWHYDLIKEIEKVAYDLTMQSLGQEGARRMV